MKGRNSNNLDRFQSGLFFNAGYLDKASEPSIYRMKNGREIPYQMAQK